MTQFIEFTVFGLLLGATYGLLALPISVVYATTHSVDAAVGGHAVLAGMVAASVGGITGVVAGLSVGVLSAAIVGLIFVALRRRGVDSPITIVLATFGAAIALQSLVLWQFGRDPVVFSGFERFWSLGGVRVDPQAVVNLMVGSVLMIALVVVLRRTPIGRALRASADNPEGASLAGVPVLTLQFGAIVLGGLLAAVAGILFLYTSGIGYATGLHLTLAAIAAAAMLGFRGPVHSFVGGLLFGWVEALVGGYFAGALATAIPFAFILVILATNRGITEVVRP